MAALPTILLGFSEMCVKQYNNIWDLTSRVCKGRTKSYLCVYVAHGQGKWVKLILQKKRGWGKRLIESNIEQVWFVKKKLATDLWPNYFV